MQLPRTGMDWACAKPTQYHAIACAQEQFIDLTSIKFCNNYFGYACIVSNAGNLSSVGNACIVGDAGNLSMQCR